MITLIGTITALIFLTISLIHVKWALAKSHAGNSAIPTDDGKPLFTPSTGMTLLVALALLISALLVTGTLGFRRLGLPLWLFKLGTRGVPLATCALLAFSNECAVCPLPVMIPFIIHRSASILR
jgi:hypothetical protein